MTQSSWSASFASPAASRCPLWGGSKLPPRSPIRIDIFCLDGRRLPEHLRRRAEGGWARDSRADCGHGAVLPRALWRAAGAHCRGARSKRWKAFAGLERRDKGRWRARILRGGEVGFDRESGYDVSGEARDAGVRRGRGMPFSVSGNAERLISTPKRRDRNSFRLNETGRTSRMRTLLGWSAGRYPRARLEALRDRFDDAGKTPRGVGRQTLRSDFRPERSDRGHRQRRGEAPGKTRHSVQYPVLCDRFEVASAKVNGSRRRMVPSIYGAGGLVGAGCDVSACAIGRGMPEQTSVTSLSF